MSPYFVVQTEPKIPHLAVILEDIAKNIEIICSMLHFVVWSFLLIDNTINWRSFQFPQKFPFVNHACIKPLLSIQSS